MSFIQALWLYPFYVLDVDSGPDSFLVFMGFVVGCGLIWLGFLIGDFGIALLGVGVAFVFGISVFVDIINFRAALEAAMDANAEVTTW